MTRATATPTSTPTTAATAATATTATVNTTAAASAAARWSVAAEPHDSPVAAALWRAYYTEVSDRWYQLHEGHTTDPDELEREVAADTGEYLAPPNGVLLVARYAGEPVGTAGVRLADATTAELKRVFLRPEARGRGGAALLVAAAEDAARALGAERMVLDTRGDLVEARALYARLGYVESAPHNDHAYADHWFTKALTGTWATWDRAPQGDLAT
ncbi:GNAT family N-acetyltransferase [Streptomyces caniscabiei]|uniref:GNAT family N-acetyltransferase n=1 Tax=Streptomyces caniscabiei TaxID=2746961 RepID=A0A927QHY8_9ACTN|nr:GNAT family N-acetyltransferase [Streptomyces caniscabiei]MBD9727798.1 GNAT family N-acetyltransferase [Streptomyces caniscabiei]MDX3513528.1 GNAT family N-acetyltransferase [Streptomyces caniscabiei]MDX3722337.1 GNAT family N-acetyltransferase [Streptomyces caniscabiei]WEO27361.1 GNAT family N-acetyltransferase [Streptomyces caniscabiei]